MSDGAFRLDKLCLEHVWETLLATLVPDWYLHPLFSWEAAGRAVGPGPPQQARPQVKDIKVEWMWPVSGLSLYGPAIEIILAVWPRVTLLPDKKQGAPVPQGGMLV